MLLFVNICLHNIKDQIKRYFTLRQEASVTRWGEISPFGLLFNLGGYFYFRKSSPKNGENLGYFSVDHISFFHIFGSFITNISYILIWDNFFFLSQCLIFWNFILFEPGWNIKYNYAYNLSWICYRIKSSKLKLLKIL